MQKIWRSYLAVIAVCSLHSTSAVSQTSGPDVLVGLVDGLRENSRTPTGQIGLTAATDSCNVGDEGIAWYRFPRTDHPVIALNLYKQSGGEFKQIAQSWVKHGFAALNDNNCPNYKGRQPVCENSTGTDVLQPGCSDLYGEFLNANPLFLGPRSKIDPSSGEFGIDARDLTGYPPSTDAEKIMLVPETELVAPATDKFLVESIYISAADASAGNSRNNVSYREVTLDDTSGFWFSSNQGPVMLGEPAIVSMSDRDNAMVSEVELSEGDGISGYVFVSSAVTPLGSGNFRYDYTIFNLNSAASVRSFTLPVADGMVLEATEGFSFPEARGEIWSSDDWSFARSGTFVSWSTDDEGTNALANAIRWGTGYSFWFESSNQPELGTATLGRFLADAEPMSFSAEVLLPGS